LVELHVVRARPKGKHKAIIDQKLWDDVHSILATNAHKRGNYTRAKIPFLLKGMVFAEDGRALTTWSSTKKKRVNIIPKFLINNGFVFSFF
jgi:hypothetical protein